jgi:hypothetical protein
MGNERNVLIYRIVRLEYSGVVVVGPDDVVGRVKGDHGVAKVGLLCAGKAPKRFAKQNN